MRKLNLQNIAYFRASESYSILVDTNGSSQIISRPLKLYEPHLKAHGWCRIHRSFMVNPEFVKGFSSSKECLLIQGGAELPISRRKKSDVLKYWHQLFSMRFFIKN